MTTDDHSKSYDILHQETLYQGWFRLDRLHARHIDVHGEWTEVHTHEVLERGRRSVGVLLFDPHEDKTILIEQFRPGPAVRGDSPWMLEIVAGMVDGDESREIAARRESKEGTGCIVQDLHPIMAYYPSPGCLSEHIMLFAGYVRIPAVLNQAAGKIDEGEDIRVHVFDAAQAISLLSAGRLRDAHSIIAMQWFALHHTGLRSRWLMRDMGASII